MRQPKPLHACHRDAGLMEAFCSISVPIANLSPGPVLDLLMRFTVSSDRQMSPRLARQLIAHASRSSLKLSSLGAARLLTYSLSEDDKVSMAATDVLGLMVPLLDGCSRPLTASLQGQPLYLGNQDDRVLFERLAGCLVDTSSLTDHCMKR